MSNIKYIVVSFLNRITNQEELLLLGSNKIIYNQDHEEICEQNYFCNEDLSELYSQNF